MRVAAGGKVSRAAIGFMLIGLLAASEPTRTTAQGAPEPPQRWDGLIERLSTPNQWYPEWFGGARMSRHAVSADGRYFVFSAELPNPPYQATTEFFIRDRQTGETTVSGPGPLNAPPVISSDGNHVAVELCDPVYHQDYQPICDVWTIDRRNFMFQNMSTALDGAASTDNSSDPVLSRDGRFIVFRTSSPTLLPVGAAPGQLVLRDRDTDGNGILDEPNGSSIAVVSVSSSGEPGNGESAAPEVSADGRFIAFRSHASNLVANDTNGAWDVFLHDVQTGETRRLNVGWDGQQATPTVDSPAISMSADGAFIAFASDDSYMTDPPTALFDDNEAVDTFVFDRVANTLSRINLGVDGALGNGDTYWPSLSADGRYLSVVSTATNVANPGTPGRAHVFVYDRVTSQATRVSVKPDGTEPDRDCSYSTISGDGSLVTFVSQAANLPTGAAPDTDTIYAAVHFDVTPLTLTIPARGGDVSATVTAQQYVNWEAQFGEWTWLNIGPTRPWGTGNGTVSFHADRNYDPVARAMNVMLQSKTIAVTQQAGLNITGFSPAQGPATGGTVVTITGAGFEPDMDVMFGGVEASFEFVNATLIRAVTPAHEPADAWVGVNTSDWFGAAAEQMFRFTDVTPPQIYPWASGNQTPDGWFTSDVQIGFSYWDPDSNVTSTEGCFHPDLTTDTAGTTYTCSVTSEGGTATASMTVKRDATPPVIDVLSPQQTVYPVGANPGPVGYACSDDLTGVAECTGPPLGTPVDMSPGFHDLDVFTRDVAGNFAPRHLTYVVALGVCTERPPSLVGWFPFETAGGGTPQPSYNDAVSAIEGTPVDTQIGVGAVGSFAMLGNGTSSYVTAGEAFRQTGAFTLAAWVKPGASTGKVEVIAGREGEYLLAVFPDGSVRWSLATASLGWGWYHTGIVLQRHVWSHVALAYNGSLVQSYLNGQLASGVWASGPLGDVAPELNDFRIGARQDPASPSYFSGAIDDVLLADRALSSLEIQGITLAGSDGLCDPRDTTLTIAPSPVTVAYGESVQQVFTVTLSSETGAIAGRNVLFFDPSGSLLAPGETDANGQVRFGATVTASTTGTQPGFQARFLGDFYFTASSGSGLISGELAVPSIVWPSPAAIAYGTPLGAGQLNATASVAGTFVYAPSAGTVLAVGPHSLHVQFLPDAAEHYVASERSVVIEVTKATPVVSLTGGEFAYDGNTHAATGSVTGVGGEALGPLTFTYSGSSSAPVNVGTYEVVASFAGDANHSAATATGTLAITRGTPAIEIASAPLFYTGQPRQATVTIRGVGGVELYPYTVSYNGGTAQPVDAATYAVHVQFDGNATYAPASADGTLVINKTTPIMGLVAPTLTYDGQPHGASASVIGVNNQALTPVLITYDGSSTDPVEAGVYTVEARYDGSANYTAVSQTTTLTIVRAVPYLTWPIPASVTYGTPLGAGQLTATSNVPGTFSYSPAAGTVLPAGSHRLDAAFTAADAVNYATVSTFTTLLVNKAYPIVTWPAPADIVYGTALGAAELNATANAPGTFTYSPAAGTVLNAGAQALHVTFTPDDTANYNAGSGAALLRVNPAAPAITWPAPADIVYGTALGPAQLNAAANVPGTFVYTPAPGTVLEPAAEQTLSVAFTPEDSANYATASRTTTMTVRRATPIVSWPPPAAITYGTALGDAQLNASATVAGTFEYTPAAGTVLSAGAQTLSVTFTPADPARYTTATLDMPLTVSRRLPVIAWNEPAPITYGTPLAAAELDATADVPGTFTYTPAAGMVLDPGVHTLSVSFGPDDAANYSTVATATTTITVARAMPVITWPASAAIVYGTPLGPSQLNATADVTGTFTYSPASGAVLGAGVRTLSVTFTPAEENRYTSATATATLNVTKATASVTWGTPAAIVYGTTLGASQLNATASTAGTFNYSPAAGTVLNAATGHPLNVTFTPADTANYAGASASASITVTPAPLSVRANDAVKRFGAPLAPFNATFAGFVNGDSPASLGGVLGFTTSATQTSPVGTYPIVPGGLSSPNYAIAFVGGTLTVVKGAVSMAVSSSPEPSGSGMPMTFTATVAAAAPAAGNPAGVVRFFDGTTLLGTAAILGGSATLTTAGLDPGVRTIEARYDGDGSFETGVVSSSHVVNTAAFTPVLSISSSRNPSSTGQTVTLTANVTMSSGAVSGTVSFYDGATLIGSATIASGRATLTTAALANGSHAITARFLGSAQAPPSISPVFVQAVGANGWKNRATTTSVAASANPSPLGGAVVFTATVTSSSSAPSGRVLFMVDGQVVGDPAGVPVTPVSGATVRAALSVQGLAHGRHTVTATYLGDSTFKGSAGVLTENVN